MTRGLQIRTSVSGLSRFHNEAVVLLYSIKMADYKTVGVGDISFLVQKTGLSDPSLRLVIGLLAGTTIF